MIRNNFKKSFRIFVCRIREMKYLNRWIIFMTDLIISVFSSICIALCFAFYIINRHSPEHFYIIALISLIASAIAILTFKSYCNIIRYSNLHEIWSLLIMSITKDLIIGIAFLSLQWLSFNQTLLFTFSDFMLTFVMLVSVRLVILNLYNLLILTGFSRRKNVWIYGIDSSSVSLAQNVNNVYMSDYIIRGFIVTEPKVGRLRISDYKIHFADTIERLDSEVRCHNINAILFPNMRMVKKQKENLVMMCVKLKIPILVVPEVQEMKDGNIHNRIRPIKIEDLLGRDEIKINMQSIAAGFAGKVIMVTGAAGSIGSELCRQLAGLNVKELVLFDNAESPMHEIRLELERCFPYLKFIPYIGDIREKERLENAFREFHPNVVFQAAAYKHVPLMEENPCEAIKVNVGGTRLLSDLCVKYDVGKMVMVSTDKAVNPTNIMGASKRLAEIYIQALGLAIEKGTIKGKTKFVTTRFGNVLGSNGSVIPYFRKEIENGGPVTVTHPDITRFFMTIPEACRLVMEAANLTTGNQIFVFDMGKSVKIIDLAEKMIRLAGYTPYRDIDIKITGLRPGEKLYEEVLSNEENTLPTVHDKIRIAKVREYKYDDVISDFNRLIRFAIRSKIDDMVILMKRMVPEFKSMNSVFEKFDQN